MTFSRKSASWGRLAKGTTSLVSMGIALVGMSTFARADVIRVNQLGYKPGARKVATLISNTDGLTGTTFTIVDGSGNSYPFTVGSDRGSWGTFNNTWPLTNTPVTARFKHLYTCDFSSFTNTGSNFKVVYGSTQSPAFKIGTDVYNALPATSLNFFAVQRCGNTTPSVSVHDACHKTDGKVGSTSYVAVGGWHDASDFIKFTATIGHAADAIMLSYIHHPELFSNPDTGILAEAKYGLDYLKSIWTGSTLYCSVADGTEHGRFVWPENDGTSSDPYGGAPRPIHTCQTATGANLAGKTAAALAMGAVVWKTSNPTLSNSYIQAAKAIYAWGKANNTGSSSSDTNGVAHDPDEFYVDSEWRDKMALAAAEIVRYDPSASDAATYLSEAKTWLSQCGTSGDYSTLTKVQNYGLNWSRNYHWANYEVACLDSTFKSTAVSRLKKHLDYTQSRANSSKWWMGELATWGSFESSSYLALEALLYQELSGDASYANFAQQQVDMMLGANPWGVCAVAGLGSTYWDHPRHRVTVMKRTQANKSGTVQPDPNFHLVGAWAEGPNSSANYTSSTDGQMDKWDSTERALAANVEMEKYNDSSMVWFDNHLDYTTNEPTIGSNAAGLALSSWLASGTPVQTYSVTASAGTGGTITPSGTVTVNQGTSQTFTIAANAGYTISAVTVDGTSKGAISTYTFPSTTTGSHTISATFVTAPTYTITASAGTGGTITPSGTVTVNQGTAKTFTIAANSGYAINAVTVDGTSQGAISTYTFPSTTTGSHTISASFTATSDSNIAPSGTGYVWYKNTSATSNSNRKAKTGINDGNLTTDVTWASGESTNAWEGAGVVFSAAKTISKVDFINGAQDSGGNGWLEGNIGLQFSTDGTTWTAASGWTISPAYSYTSTACGQTFTFTGTAQSNVKGVRIVGQVRVADVSWKWIVKEVRVYGH